MYKTEISYQTAISRHPNEISQVIKQISNSKSKDKDTPLSAFKFQYDCVVLCGNRQNRTNPSTIEEKILQKIQNTRCVLMAKFKRLIIYVKISEIPPEIIDKITENETRSHNELLRFNALSPEEKQEETNAALTELLKMPGFVAISCKK